MKVWIILYVRKGFWQAVGRDWRRAEGEGKNWILPRRRAGAGGANGAGMVRTWEPRRPGDGGGEKGVARGFRRGRRDGAARNWYLAIGFLIAAV